MCIRDRATLPITAMVIGMWFGTLPVGWLARRFGRRFALPTGSGFGVLSRQHSYLGAMNGQFCRRFALQTGSVFGVLSGLISYSAVMNGQFWLLLIGTFCGGLYAAAHNST